MPKAKDNILIFHLRLNVDNPVHMKIAKVLNNLNPDIYKSKNKYIADALEFYIDNYGSDAFTLNKMIEDNSFVKKKEFNSLIEEMKAEAVTAAKNEVIRILGGIVMNSGSIANVAEHTVRQEQTDETVSDLVSGWDDI